MLGAFISNQEIGLVAQQTPHLSGGQPWGWRPDVVLELKEKKRVAFEHSSFLKKQRQRWTTISRATFLAFVLSWLRETFYVADRVEAAVFASRMRKTCWPSPTHDDISVGGSVKTAALPKRFMFEPLSWGHVSCQSVIRWRGRAKCRQSRQLRRCSTCFPPSN